MPKIQQKLALCHILAIAMFDTPFLAFPFHVSLVNLNCPVLTAIVSLLISEWIFRKSL